LEEATASPNALTAPGADFPVASGSMILYLASIMTETFNFSRLVGLCKDTHAEMQKGAARIAGNLLAVRNWMIGLYIVEFEQNGSDYAQYGSSTLQRLSAVLAESGGRGFSVDSLELMRRFYLAYREIPSPQDNSETVSRNCVVSVESMERLGVLSVLPSLMQTLNLTWSHYVTLMTLHLAYTYDRVGRLSSQTDLRADGLRLDGTSAPTTKTYTYDGQGQLMTSDERTVLDNTLVRRMRYDYDVLGNIVEKHTTRCVDTTYPCTEQDDPTDEYYTHWFGAATYHNSGMYALTYKSWGVTIYRERQLYFRLSDGLPELIVTIGKK